MINRTNFASTGFVLFAFMNNYHYPLYITRTFRTVQVNTAMALSPDGADQDYLVKDISQEGGRV